MRYRGRCFVAVIGMLLMLAAASGVQAAANTLVVYSWMPQEHQSVYSEAFAEFEKAHPGVKVEHIATSSGVAYWEKFQAMVAGGQAPDIFMSDCYEVPRLVTAGNVRPLDDLIARDRYNISDFFPPSYEQYRWQGKLYGLPYDFGYRVVAYNRTLFMEVGLPEPAASWTSTSWTFATAAEAMRKLAVFSPEGAVVRSGMAFSRDSVSRGWGPWFYSNGARLFVETPEGLKSGMGSREAVEVMQFVQENVATRRVLSNAGLNAFLNQTTAMYQAIPANVLPLQAAKFDWDLAPWPAGRAGHYTAGGGTGWFLGRDSKAPELAWELYKLITGRELQYKHMQKGMKAVARRSLAATAEWRGTPPPSRMDVFAQAPNYIIVEPLTPLWSEYDRILKQKLNTALWNGQQSAEVVAEEIVALANAVLK